MLFPGALAVNSTEILNHFRDQSVVGGRETIIRKRLGIDPPGILAFQFLHFPGFVLAMKWVQADVRVGILVLDDGECADGPGRQADLLPQLAREAIVQRFAGFEFPTRELPVSAESIARAALANENLFIPGDDGDGGLELLHPQALYRRGQPLSNEPTAGWNWADSISHKLL